MENGMVKLDATDEWRSLEEVDYGKEKGER